MRGTCILCTAAMESVFISAGYFQNGRNKKLPKKADRTSVRKKRIAFGVETFKMVLQQYPMINMGLGLLTNPR